MKFLFDDGGRLEAGFKGHAGDCVVRSVSIASLSPYREVYDALSDGMRTQRLTKRNKRASSARDGVNVKRKWFKDYMRSLGFEWFPTMGIGTGCRVHLYDGELPNNGRLVVSVSKHYTCVIDGVIHDTSDPQRESHRIDHFPGWESAELEPGQTRTRNGICSISRRCVYGYWKLKI